MIDRSFVFRAEHLVLDARRVLSPGWMRVAEGRVTELGAGDPPPRSAPSGREETSPREAAVLTPGLVNAHVHLDLSDLDGTQVDGRGFEPWILALVGAKVGRDEAFWRASTRRGIERCLATGTTCVGDIDASFAGVEVQASRLRAVSYGEVVGLDEEHALARVRAAAPADWARSERFVRGLSPHAPYSFAREALPAVAALTATGIPSQMHLLETPAERRWSLAAEGPIGELLQALGVPSRSRRAWQAEPLSALDAAGLLRPGFSIAHGNELRAEEVEQLRARGVGVVFCPGTHRAFGRGRDAVELLIAAGARWGLGTDGVGSGGDLDLVHQVRVAAEMHPRQGAADWFDRATRGGAEVLGVPTGVLAPGAPADFVLWDAPASPRGAAQLFEDWIRGGWAVQATWVAGACAWGGA